MTKIHEKIMRTDFAKSFKRLIILTVCVVLLGGGMSAAMLAPQIGETVSYARKWEHDSDNRQEKSDLESGSEYHGDKEEHRHEEDDFFENAVITKPTIVAVITVGITGILGALCIFLFWLTVAAWLYQAAMLSAMNGVLWLTAGLLGNVFAVVVFLLARSFIRKKCPSCGSFQSVKAQYCSSCGKAMNEKCSACGEVCMHGDRFCPSCGKQRSENES